ncbi:MAG TPA: hypothetical protein VIU61_00550 [Kofleriaceae bacterium]
MTAFVHTNLGHALACALRFEDIFYRPVEPTTPPVATRLEVTIPALAWTAIRADRDATYRFRFTPGVDVTGTHDVVVTSLDGIYVNHEPFQITLPRMMSTPPRASDFLIARPLWPTRRFHAPIGETCVIGRITSPNLPVAALRVQLYRGAAPPPLGAYTYTDANGEFVFRLLKLAGAIGDVISDVRIAVSDGNPVVVAPDMFSVELGRTQSITFTRS